MKKKITFKNVLGITFGATLYAIGYAWFLVPFKIAPGGVGGLAQIFYHYLDWPAGLTMILLNIPLFILGWMFIGKQFTFGSLYGMLMGSALTDLLAVPNLYRFGFFHEVIVKYNTGKALSAWAMTDNIFLASIAGAMLLGVGLGIIFRFRGSTGGTDIPVMILKKYFNTSITVSYLLVELALIIAVGIAFADPNLVIWGVFSLFLCSKICDIAAEGLPDIKAVMIVSHREEQIRARILKELGRNVTVFYGEGSQHDLKKILYIAINRRQITQLRDLVREEDQSAFMILHDVSDVMGYGFKSRSLQFEQK